MCLLLPAVRPSWHGPVSLSEVPAAELTGKRETTFNFRLTGPRTSPTASGTVCDSRAIITEQQQHHYEYYYYYSGLPAQQITFLLPTVSSAGRQLNAKKNTVRVGSDRFRVCPAASWWVSYTATPFNTRCRTHTCCSSCTALQQNTARECITAFTVLSHTEPYLTKPYIVLDAKHLLEFRHG